MEYVYAAMLLHKAGKSIDEESVKKVLDAAGVKTDDARVKALVAALDGVNIDEAIEKAAVAAPVAVAASSEAKSDDKPKEEKKEEKKEDDSAAAVGLGSLFG